MYHSRENDLIVDCKVSGNPRPVINWFKDDMAIELDERVQQVEHGDGGCELIINKPTSKDSGNYSCVATNSLGTLKNSHFVELSGLPMSRRESSGSEAEKKEGLTNGDSGEAGDEEGKSKGKGKGKGKAKKQDDTEPASDGGSSRRYVPELPNPKNKLNFITHLSNRTFAEGTKVKLTLVVQGPDPNIRWLKDGNPIVYGPRVKNMSKEGGLCVLEITKAIPDDTGIYTCLVKNQDSSIESSAKLHIYETKQSSDFVPTFTRAIKGN